MIIPRPPQKQEKTVKLYFAFKRVRNFCCIVAQNRRLVLYLKIDPATVVLEEGFSRDVRSVGHWATGDLEIIVDNGEDIVRVKPLIQRAYEQG